MTKSIYSNSPDDVFPNLSLARYRFTLESRNNKNFPLYQGSTWRGTLGHALRHNACPWASKNCRECRDRQSCAYFVLYESGSDEVGFKDLPRPYIIYPAESLGARVFLEMTLIGEGGDFLSHLIAGWVRAGEMGVGGNQTEFNLKRVDIIQPDGRIMEVFASNCESKGRQGVYPLADYLDVKPERPPYRVTLKTPLRLKNNNGRRDGLDLPSVFNSLAIRLSQLSRRYCGGIRPDKEAWTDLKTFLAEPGSVEFNLWWSDGRRYSNRQKACVPIGGLVGECVIEPVGQFETWRRWWRTAELFHLGKGASMGLGKITLQGV